MKNCIFYFLTFILLLASSGFSQTNPAPSATPADGLIFIVNAQNPTGTVNVTDMRDFYFKRKRQWANGENVRFIDRQSNNRIRELFLKNVLKKSNSDVEIFWIGQKLYTGDSAPLRESTDAATMQFVSSFKGAIGYVSAGANLDEYNVKPIKLVDPSED